MHGFNRLGGNSVAETVVAGMIVGDFVADFCDRADNEVHIPTGLVREFIAAEQAKLDRLVSGPGTEDASALRVAMQQIMTDKVGIFRTGADLAAAVSRAAGAARAQPAHRPAPQGGRRQPRTGHRLPHAEDAQAGAVRGLRRGAAHREPRRPFPRGLSAPRRRRVAQAHAGHLEPDGDTLPTLAYEALDVKAMELPPGWRGYGAKDYTDHPDTPKRAAEVAALRERLKNEPRFAVQQALMPYDQLLPASLRGRNERIDEPL